MCPYPSTHPRHTQVTGFFLCLCVYSIAHNRVRVPLRWCAMMVVTLRAPPPPCSTCFHYQSPPPSHPPLFFLDSRTSAKPPLQSTSLIFYSLPRGLFQFLPPHLRTASRFYFFSNLYFPRRHSVLRLWLPTPNSPLHAHCTNLCLRHPVSTVAVA